MCAVKRPLAQISNVWSFFWRMWHFLTTWTGLEHLAFVFLPLHMWQAFNKRNNSWAKWHKRCFTDLISLYLRQAIHNSDSHVRRCEPKTQVRRTLSRKVQLTIRKFWTCWLDIHDICFKRQSFYMNSLAHIMMNWSL